MIKNTDVEVPRESPFPSRNRFRHYHGWLTGLALVLCLSAFFYHFSVIRKTAVNIPYFDDWNLFTRTNPATIDSRWLYEQVNDHRTATTKVLVWLEFKINGWNHRKHSQLSFILYAVCVGWLAWFARRLAPGLPVWVILGFILFFMTPIIWTDFVIGYGVATHLWLLFMLVAVFSLFRERQGWLTIVIGCIASILAIYSFAAGIATTVVTLIGFSVFKSVRAYSARERILRRREVLQLLLVAASIGVALFVWFVDWKRTPARLPWVLPNDLKFWNFFLNLVAFAFGIDRASALWGLLCLLIVMAPVCWIFATKRTHLTAAQWASLTVVAAILADLVLIAIGRTAYGIETAKYPHYAQHGMPLIIFSVVNWSFVLAQLPKLKAASLGGLWLLCLMTFAGNWDFHMYQRVYQDKLEGQRCVKEFYERGSFKQTGPDARCPTIFPWPGSMEAILNRAKKINPSYYRELTEKGK